MEHKVPFLNVSSFVIHEASSGIRQLSAPPNSPFMSVYESEESGELTDRETDAKVEFLNELYNEEFDEALFGMVNEVAALYAGNPSHPVALALREAMEKFSIPQEQLQEIISGMEMDLEQARYANFESLHLYCYRVASVVGLLAAEIFGYTDPSTLKYAHDLGLAFQLTNIIRDVGEDARRGRIYLPQDELQNFSVTEADLIASRYSENFLALMQFQLERARAMYELAFAQLPSTDRRPQRAGLIMAAIYQATLNEIERDGCKVLHQRIALTPLRKLWIAGRTWLANR